MKYGSHISFSSPSYLVGACEESIKNKANSMMIYLGAPQQAKIVEFEKIKYINYLENFSNQIPPENIVVHAPYIINPCSLTKGGFAVDFLIKLINLMNKMKIKYLVLHPGSHTNFSREESIDEIIINLKNVITNSKDVKILIETMSGKGNELGTTFAEISKIIKGVNSSRIGVCLDTCHIWDAGYDISKPFYVIEELKKYDLISLIDVIHVNDSKNELGSKKDRHENIGKGFIGLENIRNFIEQPEFNDAIKILETPYVDGVPIYNKEIELLFIK